MFKGASWTSVGQPTISGASTWNGYVCGGGNHGPAVLYIEDGDIVVKKYVDVRPSVVLGTAPTVPQGNTSATLPYSSPLMSPVKYSVV